MTEELAHKITEIDEEGLTTVELDIQYELITNNKEHALPLIKRIEKAIKSANKKSKRERRG